MEKTSLTMGMEEEDGVDMVEEEASPKLERSEVFGKLSKVRVGRKVDEQEEAEEGERERTMRVQSLVKVYVDSIPSTLYRRDLTN